MEGHCSTGQNPQWAVVPVEEEEEEKKKRKNETVQIFNLITLLAICFQKIKGFIFMDRYGTKLNFLPLFFKDPCLCLKQLDVISKPSNEQRCVCIVHGGVESS